MSFWLMTNTPVNISVVFETEKKTDNLIGCCVGGKHCVAFGVGTLAENIWVVTTYELCDHEQLIFYFLGLFFFSFFFFFYCQMKVIRVPS